ncbi:hypothetical protein AOQ84DRAFT_371762 [Glonium stellatum]|uniref:Cytochrome b5 heme-binding domain-containing protein n=1 Tax=Glonium stellatum TaxID=574774 RepID=A0A8E2FCG2_9PEZI|nr:hypothetical protein AOQ84DRAFT_371762 [Glonium stellatum]
MDSIAGLSTTLEVYPVEKELTAKNDAMSEIIVNGEVFDMTKYQEEHPGGKKVLRKMAWKDATKQFQKHHRDAILLRFKDELKVGVLGMEDEKKEKKETSRFAFTFVQWKRLFV